MNQLKSCVELNTLPLPQYLKSIEKLVNAYNTRFPEDGEFLGHLPRQLTFANELICSRQNFSGHLTASSLVLDTSGQKALLIYHKFLKRWLQPGGHLDPGEHPAQGAYRECLEETGLTQIKLHPWHKDDLLPLDIDSHQIPTNPNKLEFFHYHHDFLYLFQPEDATPSSEEKEINLQLEEVSDYKWVPLDELTSGDYGKRMARAVKKIRALAY